MPHYNFHEFKKIKRLLIAFDEQEWTAIDFKKTVDSFTRRLGHKLFLEKYKTINCPVCYAKMKYTNYTSYLTLYCAVNKAHYEQDIQFETFLQELKA